MTCLTLKAAKNYKKMLKNEIMLECFLACQKKLQNPQMTKKMYCIVILCPIKIDGTYCMYMIPIHTDRNLFLGCLYTSVVSEAM